MNNLKKLISVFICFVLIISCTYFSIPADAISYPQNGTINGTYVNLRSGAGTGNSIVAVMNVGDKVTVTGEKTDSSGDKWYAVTLVSTGQKGYVFAEYVTIEQSLEETLSGTLTEDGVRIRSTPWGTILTELSIGTTLQIHSKTTDSDGDLWYKVTAYKGSTAYTGYVYGEYVHISAEYEYDEEFEKHLDEQGFPESYKEKLREIHASYPNWVFLSDKLNLTWEEALNGESRVGVNTAQYTMPESWFSMEKNAYEWGNNRYVSFDTGLWYSAHRDVVAYYLDPRNFLNTAAIFHFVNLSYKPELETRESVQNILNGTFMEGKFPESTYDTYLDVIMAAAKQTGMSPSALAAMIIQEVGANGKSNSISGTVPGLKGYYNFLNIQAYEANGNSAITNGLIYASGSGTYLRPWNTRAKAIIGGAMFYVNEYIKYGQDTLYYKKFNVVDPPYYSHQYMSNVMAAASEAGHMKNAFTTAFDKQIIFSIPVYKDMPEDVVHPYPTSVGNNNYFLDSLSVSNYQLTPSFDLYTDTYALQVDSTVKTVNISATPKDSSAKVSGLGDYTLKTGDNIIKITVTATSGRTKTYTVIVNKLQGEDNSDVPEYSSNVFNISDGYITKVPQNTDVSVFKANISLKYGTVDVFTPDNVKRTGKVCTSDTVKFYNLQGELYKEYRIAIKGDISGDGKISLVDLSLLKRHLLGIDVLENAYLLSADINGDGNVSLLDLSLVKRHLLGLDIITG